MEAFLCRDCREYNDKEYGFMIIPCHPIGQLAYKKSEDYQERCCPVCGSVIYALPDGWCGHCQEG